MDTKQEVSVVRAQVTKAASIVDNLNVENAETLASAIEIRGRLHTLAKTIKDRKEAITKPINLALKEVRSLFSPVELSTANLISQVDKQIIGYKRAVDEEAKKKTEKIAARVESGTLKPQTAAKKLAELPVVQTHVKTESGAGIQFRKIAKVRIVNPELIPDKYWEINEVLLRKDVLSGIVVTGAEKYEEEIAAQSN